VAVDIKAKLGTPRAGAALLASGALCSLGAAFTSLCPMRPALAYGSTAALAITSLGTLLGWGWARMVGRVVCWANVILFAMLVVPDWDDAMTSGSYGPHTLCGVLAAYFLLCAACLGLGSRRKSVAV
jgi:hypothetical protein